jgi:hypothetical protein
MIYSAIRGHDHSHKDKCEELDLVLSANACTSFFGRMPHANRGFARVRDDKWNRRRDTR